MDNGKDALNQFHPLIRSWFLERTGQPTEIQENAWPRIAEGNHLLITAPTGSGKTLTAFLWALNQLVAGVWEGGGTRVLYVSPLKALNNDIQRNLLRPLTEIQALFSQNKAAIPDIHVATRSGDTSQSDRRKMIRHPPEILITTPESLNLLLSSQSGLTILTGLKTVILDEIHSVVDAKRGTHLITAVDRLVPLSGDFQRIALSATVKPLDVISDFIGGYTLTGTAEAGIYKPRQVMTLQSVTEKKMDLRVFSPEHEKTQEDSDSFWDDVVPEFKKIIKQNRSTLVFVNSRRLCEKITYWINQGEELPLAYSHHGSLSREIREEVEAKLKGGELRAIVATSSLEMGIDIGELDEVLLVQSPSSIASTVQRIGRAGHQVGAVSRACLFPTHAFDAIQAAVLAEEIVDPDIEETYPVEGPLDVLSQIIISMVGTQIWNIDELYAFIKTSYPYRQLSRKQFDLVLDMLAGRYADSLIRELKPKISIDRLDHTVVAKKGALLSLYMSGGTIPDRGYYNLRHSESGARIGELDEEFVWEAYTGKVFSVGNQSWRVERITHNDVFVRQASPRLMDIPFWKSEEFNRGFHLSDKMARFLEKANERLGDQRFVSQLRQDCQMDQPSVDYLLRFLSRQKEQTQTDLPHRHHLLVEYVSAGPGSGPGNQIVLHTLWGGQLNRPYAMALEAAWEDKYHHKLELFPGNDSIVLLLPHKASPDELLSLITSGNFEALLRKQLEGSGFFGGRFRECAGRSLLVSRNKINQRMPLWMTRLKSQKLLESVRQYEDFPILLETWRTCLRDEFDLEKLKQILDELTSGEIRVTAVDTAFPSPFANGVAWNQINKFMYQEDQSLSGGDRSNLSDELIKEMLRSPDLRPDIPDAVVQAFEAKRQRLYPGYAPQTARDLIDWVKDRLLIPDGEWLALLDAIDRDSEISASELVDASSDKLVRVYPEGEQRHLICALETLPSVIQAVYPVMPCLKIKTLSGRSLPVPVTTADSETDTDFSHLFGQWLQFYGPIGMNRMIDLLGGTRQTIEDALEDLIEPQILVTGILREKSDTIEFCDSENLGTLLRLKRKAAIPVFDPLGAESLSLFLAWFQGLTKKADSVDNLFPLVEKLMCYSAPADLWESEFFPARSHQYQPSWLDDLIREAELQWVGTGKSRIVFCYDTDRELLNDIPAEAETNRVQTDSHSDETLFSDAMGRYSFSALLSRSSLSPSKLAAHIWRLVWDGQVTNDTFAALRKGLENKFKLADVTDTASPSRRAGHRQSRRSGFNQWRGAIPLAGNWYRLSDVDPPEGMIEKEERTKDRVRILFDRYGIVFRELVMKELPAFSWSSIFRSLRLMELSGEILAGYFFKGPSGPQFMSHQAFRMLQSGLPETSVYWVNAADPASLCGVQVEDLKIGLPKRLSTSHLVYAGTRLVLTSQKNGKSLEIFCSPDDDRLFEYFGPLKHLLYRQFKPVKSITIESINGESAAKSPFVDKLGTAFEILRERQQVVLYRKI